MNYSIFFYKQDGTTKLFSCSTGETTSVNNDTAAVCNAQITYLHYEKRIYQPCRIDVVLKLTSLNASMIDIRDLFLARVCSMTSIYDDTIKVAENYFVYEATPEVRFEIGEKHNYMSLVIYSVDKLMDMVEECHSYVGQYLCKSILPAAITRYTAGTSFTITTNAGTDNLQFLKYKIDNTCYEFIQPYLVQYNETFYSMLARTTNRCGEFMYFEDGKLNIGLAYNSSSEAKSGFTVMSSSNLPTLGRNFFHEPKLYSHNYMTGSESITTTHTYEMEGLDLPAKRSDASFIYDYDVSSDEFHTEFSKDPLTSKSYSEYISNTNIALSIFFRVLNKPGFFATVIAMVMAQAGMEWGNYVLQTKYGNDQYNDKLSNVKPQDATNKEYESGNKHRLYSSLDNTDADAVMTNILHRGLTLIRKCEQSIADCKVNIKLNTAVKNTQLKLGDKIKYNDNTLIVTAMSGCYDGSKKDDIYTESVEAIPPTKIAKDKTSAGVTFLIPPMIPAGHVRYAEPQTAKVKENIDPDKLGRVRVIYSWQESETDDVFKTPTPFIRVSTPFATPNGGVYFLPAENEEVMICYEHGNVERPFVSCSLFNSTNMPPIGSDKSAPAMRSITTPNGHMLTFADTSDWGFLSAIVKMPCLKTVMNSANGSYQEETGKSCAGGITLKQKHGFYTVAASTDTRSINFSSPIGNVKINAFTGIDFNTPHGDLNITGKNITIKARNRINVNSGIALTQNALEVVGNKETWQSFVEDSVKDYVIDLSLVRAVIERIIEPVGADISLEAATKITKFEGLKQSKSFWKTAGTQFKGMFGFTDNEEWKTSHFRKKVSVNEALARVADEGKGPEYKDKKNSNDQHDNNNDVDKVNNSENNEQNSFGQEKEEEVGVFDA